MSVIPFKITLNMEGIYMQWFHRHSSSVCPIYFLMYRSPHWIVHQFVSMTSRIICIDNLLFGSKSHSQSWNKLISCNPPSLTISFLLNLAPQQLGLVKNKDRCYILIACWFSWIHLIFHINLLVPFFVITDVITKWSTL